jgi:5-methylcytosine-specific restriction endonuclease McrA
VTNIFLAPRANETSYKNFESTIVGGRTYKFLEPYLTQTEKEALSRYQKKKISVWGNKESLKARWLKMRPGDYVLFYARGKFYYSGRVVLTKFSNELGAKLWPLDKQDGKPWNCLFFIDNLRKINLPIGILQEMADYSEDWKVVMGFMPLREAATQAIVEKFGSVENFINQDPKILEVLTNIVGANRSETIEDEVREINKKQVLKEVLAYVPPNEGYVLSTAPKKVRVESRKQKLKIAQLEGHACQICNWSLEWINKKGKKSFRIDIDHILDKAQGGTEMAQNLWALCPNCHVKKTLGVIKIDIKNKKVFEGKKEIKLHHDSHLGWYRKTLSS